MILAVGLASGLALLTDSDFDGEFESFIAAGDLMIPAILSIMLSFILVNLHDGVYLIPRLPFPCLLVPPPIQ